MTKPDEALLWARERMATRCDEDGFPDVAESYRRGYRDESLREDFEAYRAGAAESADREEELEARVAELEAEVQELKGALTAASLFATPQAAQNILALLKEADQ